MKLIKLSALLVLALALSLGTTGCKKKNRAVTKIPDGSTRVGTPGPTTVDTRPIGFGDNDLNSRPIGSHPQPAIDQETLNTDRNHWASSTVHFTFDSAAVRSSEQSKITTVASELKSNPNLYVIIEGHCDERGTEGYNQALGEKRATALRDELINLGVSSEHVFTKSFGEMQPAADGHNEAAWGQNRRGEFIAGTPK